MEPVYSVFKEIEPPDYCPPNVQNELVSEIDLIRNSLTLVESSLDDLFGMVATFLEAIPLPPRSPGEGSPTERLNA